MTLAEQVVNLVMQIRQRMPRIGTRKLYHLLRSQLQALKVGRDKLFNILKANHLLIFPKRSYRVTTNTHHRFYKHKDLVSALHINRPEQVWVADITYLGNRNQPAYVAMITDAYSKKIVGYDVSNSLGVDGSLRALRMAHSNRKYSDQPLIHHSDKGIQYCCDDYQQQLSTNKITCSMTQGYDPYSNAVAERVNGIIKHEFELENHQQPIEIIKKIVEQSIAIYNSQRPHFSCSMLTPNQMHCQQKIEIKTYKTKTGNRLEPVSG